MGDNDEENKPPTVSNATNAIPEPAMDSNTMMIRMLQMQVQQQQQQLMQQQQQILQAQQLQPMPMFQPYLFGPQIAPFDIAKREEWEDWIRLFRKSEFFKSCTTDREKIDRLEFSMGVQAAAELRKLRISDQEAATFESVVEALNVHFMGRKTTIYRRYLFRARVQKTNETVETFITDVKYLASHCKFDSMEDPESEMIRDQLVWGCNDQQLRETLLADSKLSLDRVVRKMQAREQSRRENTSMSSSKSTLDAAPSSSVCETSTVDRVMSRTSKSGARSSGRSSSTRNDKSTATVSDRHCYSCGAPNYNISHKSKCPAKTAKCSSCNTTGHYAKMCRRTKSVSEITLPSLDQSFSSGSEEGFFINSIVDDDPAHDAKINAIKPSPQRRRHQFVGRIFFNGALIKAKLDSGAEVSVIPPHLVPSDAIVHPTNRKLKGAGDVPLVVRGCVRLPLANWRRKMMENFFVVEQQSQLLIGAPAIAELGILQMDPWSRVASVEQQQTNLEAKVRQTFPKLFSDSLGKLPYEYRIELKPNAQPYAVATARNVAIPMRAPVLKELDRMVQQQVIERVSRPTEWCAPMVVARKKGGEVRICTDFSQLNHYVRRPRIILPDVESSLAEIGRSRVFSKLDAASGFWQVPLHPACRDLTTFISPAGRFRYCRLPFGITSAPEFFQASMTDLLNGLSGVTCHMDDVLVYGVNRAEHDRNLFKVLEKMNAAGLVLKPSKCVFAQSSVKFLGQVINGEWVGPDPERVRAIAQFPKPVTIKGVRRLLGMINQLSKFVPGLAEMSLPIRLLLKKDTVIQWEEQQQVALQRIVDAITRTTQLLRYDVKAQTAVVSDASNEGLGAVLLQTDSEGVWRPVSFGSRTLLAAERNYASIEKEALAVTWAVEKFRPFLDGKEFEIQTDHQPLITLFGKKDLSQVPLRIQRFKIRLLPYVFTIRHVPGRELHIADFLSRHPLPHGDQDAKDAAEVESFVHQIIVATVAMSEGRRSQIAEAQKADEECRMLRRMLQEGWPKYQARVPATVRHWFQYRNEIVDEDQLLRWRTRVIIPCDMRQAMLNLIHDGHLGVNKCQSRARHTVFWPSISDDVIRTVQACITCSKFRAPQRAPLLHHEGADRPWQKIGLDVFFMENGSYALWVDYYSGFVEVAKLVRLTCAEMVEHSKEIFGRHGIPEVVMSDAAAQFTGAEWASFAQEYGFEIVSSSPYYHRSNGLAERAVQTVKSLFKKNTDVHLALLSYRSTPNATGYSPAQLLMGRCLRTRLPFEPSRMRSVDFQKFEKTRARNRAKAKEHYDRKHRVVAPRQFAIGQQVFVPDIAQYATIEGPADTPRSWWLTHGQGRRIRRNQQDLRPLDTRSSPITPPSTVPTPQPNDTLLSDSEAEEIDGEEEHEDEDANESPTLGSGSNGSQPAPVPSTAGETSPDRQEPQELPPTTSRLSQSSTRKTSSIPTRRRPARSLRQRITLRKRSPRPQRQHQKPARYRDGAQ